MRQNSRGNTTWMAAAVILAILIIFVIFIVASPPSEKAKWLPGYGAPGENYSRAVFSDHDVNLRLGTVETLNKEYNIPDFAINGMPTEADLSLADSLDIKSSTWSQVKESRVFEADANLVQAYLVFRVADREKQGKLIVKLNDNKIYEELVAAGQDVSILLPEDLIEKGNSTNGTSVGVKNTIELSVEKPSGMHWLTNNKYKLSALKIKKSLFDPKSASAEYAIDLSTSEAAEITDAELRAVVEKPLDAYSKAVTIEINNRTVFNQVPSSYISIDKVKADVPAGLLVSGQNRIKVSTAVYGRYAFTAVHLAAKLSHYNESRIVAYDIKLGENDWSVVNAQQATHVCALSMERKSGDDSVSVTLNGHDMRYSFVGDAISEDVCKYLQQDKNTLILKADNELLLKSLKLAIRNK